MDNVSDFWNAGMQEECHGTLSCKRLHHELERSSIL